MEDRVDGADRIFQASASSIGMASGGSMKKLSSTMRAMAARTDSSVAGSTVITNGRSRQLALGNCNTASIEIFSAASAAASCAMMPGPILHAESQIISRAVQRHRDRLVFSQPRVGERRDTFRAAGADLARHAHQVADHGDSGGMGARAAAVIKRIRAELAAHPDRVVRSANAGENGRLRDQRRTHGKNSPSRSLARRADQPDGVMQLVRVFEIDWRDAANALGVDIGGNNALAERERRENRQLRARVEAIHVGGRVGFGVAGLLRFGQHFIEAWRRGFRSR